MSLLLRYKNSKSSDFFLTEEVLVSDSFLKGINIVLSTTLSTKPFGKSVIKKEIRAQERENAHHTFKDIYTIFMLRELSTDGKWIQ